MTITLTSDELANFASELGSWYRAQLVYILQNSERILDPMTRTPMKERINQLRAEFAASTPQPNWKDFLG